MRKKYKNNRYKVELENGQEIETNLQLLKVWGHLTFLVRPSQLSVVRDKKNKDHFHFFYGRAYEGSAKIIPDPNMKESDEKIGYIPREIKLEESNLNL